MDGGEKAVVEDEDLADKVAADSVIGTGIIIIMQTDMLTNGISRICTVNNIII